jgi:hypothetical protein
MALKKTVAGIGYCHPVSGLHAEGYRAIIQDVDENDYKNTNNEKVLGPFPDTDKANEAADKYIASQSKKKPE